MVSQPRSVQSSRWDEAIFLMIPGTSCLATIVLSLRDKIRSTTEALLKLALMGSKPGACQSVGTKRVKRDALLTTLENAQLRRTSREGCDRRHILLMEQRCVTVALARSSHV
jgi:hypothetical protein